MKRPIEGYVGDRLLRIRKMDLRDRLRRFVLQHKVAGSAEGTAFRIDVDLRIDRNDLGLRQVLVFLEVLFVVCLDIAPVLVGQVSFNTWVL